MEDDADNADAGSDLADTVPFLNTSDEEEQDDVIYGSSSDEDGIVPTSTFDRALPVRHSYLGSNLEELRGRTLLDEDTIHTIPILPEPGVVLVPGQTLPLAVFYPSTVSMLRRIITTDHTFGVVCVRYVTSETEPTVLADIGTTAEIYAFQEESETSGLKIKALGRQRFRVIDTHRKIDGNVTARVQILPEIILADPLAAARFPSSDRFRNSTRKLTKLERRDALVTRWPSWVHSQYQIQNLIEKITRYLHYMKIGSVATYPKDPVELSFWIAQSMPLNEEQKLELLKINCAIQRLRWLLSILEKYRILCCEKCNLRIAHRRDIFSMSVEGPQGTYVNSGGYIHETVTVYSARGLKLMGSIPSTEYSWFPGYAWIITQCRRCESHMGWMFTATRTGLSPLRFWGLCRSALAPKLETDEDNDFKPVM